MSSDLTLGRTRGFYQVAYGCDPDKVAQARALVIRDLKQMQTAPVTGAELQRAKALMLRGIPLRQASVDSIAASLLRYSVEGLPLDQPMITAHRVLRLTAPEVQAAYKQWLRPDDLVEIVKGPTPQ